MKLTSFIARRFLLGEKRAGTNRFSGWIAIIGMAVGSFALVLSVAVLNGFEQRVTDKIVGIEGDARLTGLNISKENPVSEISGNTVVWASMPYLQRKGLIMSDPGQPRMVRLKGVDLGTFQEFYHLDWEQAPSDSLETERCVFIGRLLANRLAVDIGDDLLIMSPVDQSMTIGFPRRLRLTVGGIFRADILDFDDRQVFIPYQTAKTLFQRKKTIDGLDLRLNSTTDRVETVVENLVKTLPDSIQIETWFSLHEGLFKAMKMERLGAIIVLSLIILVASFNLTATLVMVSYQKTREIGILRTIGATATMIRNILIKQGLFIGSAGALVGLGLGILLVLVQHSTGIIPLPEDIYAMTALPMKLSWQEIILIPLIAFGLIMGASLLSARRAMHIQPREAVHQEK